MEERQKAEAMYAKAMAEGGKVPLLAGHSSSGNRGQIKINLGNFPKNHKAVVTCFMYTQLAKEGSSFNFRLPLTYIPQYLLSPP